MNEIERAARLSIGRACGPALFAIAVSVMALSFDPVLAADVGAILSLGLAVGLVIHARRGRHGPLETSEVWLLIDSKSRAPGRHASRLVSEARRSAMLWFARCAVALSAVFALFAIAVSTIHAS